MPGIRRHLVRAGGGASEDTPLKVEAWPIEGVLA
jgi:hypothetical protein